jgi:hypothetical protein
VKELVIVAQTMVGGETLWWGGSKFKGLGGGGGIICSKAKAHERTPSSVKQKKGVDEWIWFF